MISQMRYRKLGKTGKDYKRKISATIETNREEKRYDREKLYFCGCSGYDFGT